MYYTKMMFSITNFDCLALIVNHNVVSPTLNVNPTLFFIPFDYIYAYICMYVYMYMYVHVYIYMFGGRWGYRLTMLQLLSLIK